MKNLGLLSGRLRPALLLTTVVLVSSSAGVASAATGAAFPSSAIDTAVSAPVQVVDTVEGVVGETANTVVGDTVETADESVQTVADTATETVEQTATDTVDRLVGGAADATRDPVTGASGSARPVGDGAASTPTAPSGTPSGANGFDAAQESHARTAVTGASGSVAARATRDGNSRGPLGPGRARSERAGGRGPDHGRSDDVGALVGAGDELVPGKRVDPAAGDSMHDQSSGGLSDLTRRFLAGGLPFTGFALYMWMLAGLLLVASGAALLAVRRGRQGLRTSLFARTT